MLDREEKELFSYKKFEKTITHSGKFKQIEQMVLYPQKKQAVILFFEKLLKDIDDTALSEKTKKSLFDFMCFVRDETISLVDIDDAYSALMDEYVLKKFLPTLDQAFKNNLISLKKHYNTVQFFKNIQNAKITLALMTEDDKVPEDKYSAVKMVVLNHIFDQSGLFFYFKKNFEKYYRDWLPNVLNAPRFIQAMLFDYLDLKEKINSKLLINFVDKHFFNFSHGLQLELSTETISDIIQAYLNFQPYFTKQFHVEFEEHALQSIYSDYQKIYHNVVGIYQQYGYSRNQSDKDDFLKLFLYTQNLVKEDVLLNELYHLAFLQEGYGRLYRSSKKNNIDKGIFYFNNTLRTMLQAVNDPIALVYIGRVGRELMHQLTSPGKCFISTGWMSVKHRQPQVHVPAFLRESLSPHDKCTNEYKKIDESRIKILRMLIKREEKYRKAIDHLILDMDDSRVNYNEKLARKLILRLVAVNYLWDQVSSNKTITSKDLIQEMVRLFGKMIFETRRFKHSSLTDIIKLIGLLTPMGNRFSGANTMFQQKLNSGMDHKHSMAANTTKYRK